MHIIKIDKRTMTKNSVLIDTQFPGKQDEKD